MMNRNMAMGLVFGSALGLGLVLGLGAVQRAQADDEPVGDGGAWTRGDGAQDARMRGERRGRGRGHGVGMLTRDIDGLATELALSDEQVAYLEGARSVMDERREERRSRRGVGPRAVMSAIETGEVDPDAVHASIDTHFDDARQTAHDVADELLGFVASLDDAQRAQLGALIEQRRGERRERMKQRSGDCEQGERCGRRGRGGRGAAMAD